jgi:hypothetical protein
MVATLTSIDL